MAFLEADEIAALRSSGQFDEQWYAEHYRDVRITGMDPAEHYLWIGRKLGREPSRPFLQDARQEAQRQLIRSSGGSAPATDCLCVFSHYDRHQKIDDYVIHYLAALVGCGFSIVFVTTCEDIADAEIDKVIPLATRIIVKKNIGFDFGAWFSGIVDSFKPAMHRKVILANDSVYGPMFDLADIVEDMGSRSLDLWGITDSIEVDYHLQTYFVVFEETALRSSFFEEFWNSYAFEVNKRKVIDNFEIGLTTRALSAGFKVGALCHYYDVRRHALRMVDDAAGIGRTTLQARVTPVNSSHFFWRALVQNCHCPFLKIELLRDNPSKIDDIFLWEQTVGEHTSFDVGLAKSHLERVAGSAMGRAVEASAKDHAEVPG